MTKLACAVLTLSMATRSLFACEEVTVLYGDTKYLLLDGDRLAVVDVGNLRWLGLFRIQAIISGSTSRLFAVSADRLSSELYRGDEKGHYPSKLVSVENVAETDNIAARVEIGHYDIQSPHAIWIGGTDRLAVWDEKASRLSLLGKDLEEIDGWQVSRFRVIDTVSGRVAVETNGAPIGRASRLFCPGAKERFVVSGNGEAHLIDLATLKTVAGVRQKCGK